MYGQSMNGNLANDDDAARDAPASKPDESIRQVFERASEEYGELCDRLFADDPDFGVDAADNLTSR